MVKEGVEMEDRLFDVFYTSLGLLALELIFNFVNGFISWELFSGDRFSWIGSISHGF